MENEFTKSSVFSKKRVSDKEIESIILYHGSDRVRQLKDISFPGLRSDCDFGRGFYLTPDKHIAEE